MDWSSSIRHGIPSDPFSVLARLGHASVSETMDTYGHLFQDGEDLGSSR